MSGAIDFPITIQRVTFQYSQFMKAMAHYGIPTDAANSILAAWLDAYEQAEADKDSTLVNLVHNDKRAAKAFWRVLEDFGIEFINEPKYVPVIRNSGAELVH